MNTSSASKNRPTPSCGDVSDQHRRRMDNEGPRPSRLRAVVGLIGCALAAVAAGRAAPPWQTADGFAVPQPGYAFSFPRDHGSHPEFKIEWWYLTGHLFDAERKRYGFQATFFRRAAPDKSTQLYLAHMALADVARGTFVYQERLNRESWDAGARVDTLHVWNGPWSLRLARPATWSQGEGEMLRLVGGIRSDVGFRLQLEATKPAVIFGENGVSRKGDDPTAASYYITFSRLAVSGELLLGASRLAVTGEAWMDHEISSSQLAPDQVGWDWVSIHFKDEPRELMLYRLRKRDGSADAASTLQWVSPESTAIKTPFRWEVLSRWKSAKTGAEYPARVRIHTTDPASGRSVSYTVEPLLEEQELGGGLGGIPYWEGACRVLDETGREVGAAYMELTGYAKELKL